MNMHVLLHYLKKYYANAEQVEKIILDCAMVAAAAAGVGGAFPALAIPATIVSCLGAVWAMYIKICNCLGIKLSDNILKVLASAALSNIAVSLIGAFVTELALQMIPGASVVASAVITFCSIYLAGILFMKMLLAFAEMGKFGKKLESVSQNIFEEVLKKQSVSKDDLKAAKNIFNKENKTV